MWPPFFFFLGSKLLIRIINVLWRNGIPSRSYCTKGHLLDIYFYNSLLAHGRHREFTSTWGNRLLKVLIVVWYPIHVRHLVITQWLVRVVKSSRLSSWKPSSSGQRLKTKRDVKEGNSWTLDTLNWLYHIYRVQNRITDLILFVSSPYNWGHFVWRLHNSCLWIVGKCKGIQDRETYTWIISSL